MIKYIGSLAVLFIMSLMYEKYKKRESFDDESKQYELVRKYLLNHSSLAQSKKPILWIHMNYDMNARSWSSFGSRNNDHLNQPYIFLTIKSIIDKCGSDFNICIIDDSTFGKILVLLYLRFVIVWYFVFVIVWYFVFVIVWYFVFVIVWYFVFVIVWYFVFVIVWYFVMIV